MAARVVVKRRAILGETHMLLREQFRPLPMVLLSHGRWPLSSTPPVVAAAGTRGRRLARETSYRRVAIGASTRRALWAVKGLSLLGFGGKWVCSPDRLRSATELHGPAEVSEVTNETRRRG